MSVYDTLRPLLEDAGGYFSNWLAKGGSKVGRGVPNWGGTPNTPKFGGYPGWEPGMPRAPGNSPGGPRPGGTYSPSGGQMTVPQPAGLPATGAPGTQSALDAVTAQGGGSLGQQMPTFAQRFSGAPAAPQAGGPMAPRPQGSPPATQGPMSGQVNGPNPTMPGAVPNAPNMPPSRPPFQMPSAGQIGNTALAGGTALAAGSALTGAGFPNGNPNWSGGQSVGPNQPAMNMAGGGGAPTPMPRPRPANLSGGLPQRPVMNQAPPAPQAATAPQAAPQAPQQYQDPGSFNGLGIGPAGSGTSDPSLAQLKQKYPWMFPNG